MWMILLLLDSISEPKVPCLLQAPGFRLVTIMKIVIASSMVLVFNTYKAASYKQIEAPN